MANDELKELKTLVEHLEKISDKKDKDKIVSKLQEIESKLLCNYHIEINDIKVFPLLVEAYYNSECFDDKYTHGSPRQRDRFGKIYIHEIGYGGIDLCLSKEKYALSFLIKNSLVRVPKKCNDGYYEMFFTQTQLYDFLKNENNCGFESIPDVERKTYYKLKIEAIIKPDNELNEESDLVFLQRKGLETKKNIDEDKCKDKEHYNCPLAAFSIKSINNYYLTFEKGKGVAVIEYLKKYRQEHPEVSINDLEAKQKELYPNGSKVEFDREFRK